MNEEQSRALKAVTRARRSREQADERLRESIRHARKVGASAQAVADAANYTRQRIHQIEKGG